MVFAIGLMAALAAAGKAIQAFSDQETVKAIVYSVLAVVALVLGIVFNN